jgi:pilus assembly protein Flp/PilA
MTRPESLPTDTARGLGDFLADRSGATAIEYGLMAALIGVAIMSIVFSTGQGIKTTLYDRISTALAGM